MTVKLKILNKNKEVEREAILNEFETWILMDEDDDLEGAVDSALDALAEKAPASFASDEDGKFHGYEFEILDPTIDPDIRCRIDD